MNEIGARVRASGARGTYAIDVAAEALADSVPLAASPKADGTTHVMAFVGAAGAGKTTTLVKLAVKLVKARRRLALLTLGVQRAEAKRDLASYAKLLQIPCTSVVETGQLEPWMSTSARCDAVLVDTAGRGEGDVEWVRELARSVESSAWAANLETYLVLAADGTVAELGRTVRAYRDARPSACVITRLDLARSPVAALEAAADSSLPLAFLADGPEVSAHLWRANADCVSNLFLRGRLA
jgi:flagellar biosynthesis protein FlhF